MADGHWRSIGVLEDPPEPYVIQQRMERPSLDKHDPPLVPTDEHRKKKLSELTDETSRYSWMSTPAPGGRRFRHDLMTTRLPL